MANIFNLSIPHLDEWSRRQKPDHRQLNAPVETLNRLATGIGPPRVKAPVARQAMGISFAVVTALAADDSEVLFVRYLDDNDEPAGESQSVFAWPKMSNRDWETFVGTDIVVPVVLRNGLPYVMQLPRWEMRSPPEGLVIGSCQF